MMRFVAQMPLGLRKSGMPDSVEMPAPVKPTMRSDLAISLTTSSKVIGRRLMQLRQPLKVEPCLLSQPLQLFRCAATYQSILPLQIEIGISFIGRLFGQEVDKNAEHLRIYPVVIDLRLPTRLYAIELEREPGFLFFHINIVVDLHQRQS